MSLWLGQLGNHAWRIDNKLDSRHECLKSKEVLDKEIHAFNRLLCFTLKKFGFTTMYVYKIHGAVCSAGSVHSLVNSWKDDACRFIMAEFSFHNISFRIACL